MTTLEFNTQYKKIEKLLFGFAMSMTKNKENAKDLVQETLLRAYKNKHSFKMNTNFRAWMSMIMRNNFINSYRKQKTRSRVLLPVKDFIIATEHKTMADTASSSIFMQELQSLIGNLPDKQRIPFLMHHEGYQYHEISDKINVSIGTIKSRIFFARKKLREMLKENYGDTLKRA